MTHILDFINRLTKIEEELNTPPYSHSPLELVQLEQEKAYLYKHMLNQLDDRNFWDVLAAVNINIEKKEVLAVKK